MEAWHLDLGATYLGEDRVVFRVWGPHVLEMKVKIFGQNGVWFCPMAKDAEGYFSCNVSGIRPGDPYLYVLNQKKERPDPASRFQPQGVHGPSEVVDPAAFPWSDREWKGISLEHLILYELHVGTFTKQGTFDAIIPKLPYVKELGVTAIELMPVAQFSGAHNWGYDGVNLFAVQNTYGGPTGLKRLVNACHEAGIGVGLDLVYNHLGPEGNYLHDFGPYFTHRYHTPWGDAINFDGPTSHGVRDFFIQNALFWITEYHVDLLRLDAVQDIYDSGFPHILGQLGTEVKSHARRLGRDVLIIAESDLNDPILIRPRKEGGYELDAQCSDDFHHSVHVVLTGEERGYYQDYARIEDIAKAIKSGFVYDGKYSVFRQMAYGRPTTGIPGERFVISIQNHDQVGNRAFGDRLSTLVSFQAHKIAAVLLFTSPATPLIFMGEEYGETAPFQYFIDHSNEDLVEAIRRARKAHCATFGWDKISDLKDPRTFEASRLNWDLVDKNKHRHLLKLYQDLIHFRHSIPGLSRLNRKDFRVYVNETERWLALEYSSVDHGTGIGVVVSFSKEQNRILLPFQCGKTFQEMFNTECAEYGGSLSGEKRTHSNEVVLQPEHGIIGRIA